MPEAPTAPHKPAITVTTWDGQQLLAAIQAATQWLAVNRDRINALNVFPVPDGDTGTNMALTMRAAVEEADNLSADLATSVTEVAKKVAYGALMGAKGNSGVILSQVFRGFSTALDGKATITGLDLAQALDGARERAYQAVMRPVEGTMLTVIRVAAERATDHASEQATIDAVLVHALDGARDALITTPDLLEILRQAGVVDAGGQGIVYLLEGMLRTVYGEAIPTEASEESANVGLDMAFLDRIDELHGEEAFGYCTNFMIFGESMDFERARSTLAEMGESAVIVGDEQAIKVHIHALNPGKVLDYALSLGSLGQIKIDNMEAQTEVLTAQRAERERPPQPVEQLGRQTVLAVASGEGLADALQSMGAGAVVRGGQTMNPSTKDLLAAVDGATTDEVIILPNNSNIILAAKQVDHLTSKTVAVVPSTSVPQGLAALAAFNIDASLDDNVTRMTEALASVQTIELTRAVKAANIDGVTVQEGHVIGLLNDRLVASGADEREIALQVLTAAGLENADLCTVFTGEDAKPETTEHLQCLIAEHCPGVDVEVLDGGQPHYRYIIAVE